VSIDGTKIDANASKIRSARYERANDLRARLTADVAALTAQAEAADAEKDDPQALLVEIGRRETLKAKPDAACARLEAQARAEADAACPAYAAKKGGMASGGAAARPRRADLPAPGVGSATAADDARSRVSAAGAWCRAARRWCGIARPRRRQGRVR